MLNNINSYKMKILFIICIVTFLINLSNYSLIFAPRQVGENFNFVYPNHSEIKMNKPSTHLTHETRAGNGFEVLEYYVKIELMPIVHYLNATALIKFEAIESINTLYFTLFPELNVTRVYDENSYDLQWERDSWGIIIVLNETLVSGNVSNITIDYEGTISYDNSLIWCHYIGPEGIYLHNENNNNASWFPWNGLATVLIDVIVPKGLTVVCQGELLGVVDFTSSTTYSWYIGFPREPQVMLFADIYNVYYTTFEDKNVSIYLLDSETGWNTTLISESMKILEYYSSSFSELDINRLVILESTFQASRGYAADSYVIIHKTVFEEGYKSVFQTLSHEISHQWWGHLVRPMFEGPASRWLYEGFAHYSSILYEMHSNNSKRLLDISIANYAGLVNGEFGDFEETPIATTGFGGMEAEFIVYNKGAIVLHMLRYLVGDEDFFDILSTYCQDFAHEEPTLQDFTVIVEAVSEKELDWFFDQWIFTTKHLDYGIRKVTQEKINSNWRAEITIERLDEAVMPIDLTVYTEEDEPIHMAKVWNGTGNSTTISITTESRVHKVELDSEQWLLDVNRANNLYTVETSLENYMIVLLIILTIILIVVVGIIILRKYKS